MICSRCGEEIRSELRHAFDNLMSVPAGVELYSNGGQDTFAVYGASGGVVSKNMAYLIERCADGKHMTYAFYVGKDAEADLKKALHNFLEGEHRVVDLENGDDLGLPG